MKIGDFGLAAKI